jgi:hypothetical protein
MSPGEQMEARLFNNHRLSASKTQYNSRFPWNWSDGYGTSWNNRTMIGCKSARSAQTIRIATTTPNRSTRFSMNPSINGRPR